MILPPHRAPALNHGRRSGGSRRHDLVAELTTSSTGASTRCTGPALRSGLSGDPPTAGGGGCSCGRKPACGRGTDRTDPLPGPARRIGWARWRHTGSFFTFFRAAPCRFAEIAGSDGVSEGQRWTNPDRTYPKLGRSGQIIDTYRFTSSCGRLESRLIAKESRQSTSSRSASMTTNRQPTPQPRAAGAIPGS